MVFYDFPSKYSWLDLKLVLQDYYCDLMVHLENTASFSHERILLPLYVYNMHQDTKSAQLITVCTRTIRSHLNIVQEINEREF